MSTTVAPSTLVTTLGDGWRRPRASAQGLADAIRALVVDGRLAVRTRVPSERALAPELGVSRGTVSRAYDRLRSEGYLVSARGAGSFLTLPSERRGMGERRGVGPGQRRGVGVGARPGGGGGGRRGAPAAPVPGPAAPHVTDLRVAALPAPEPLLEAAV